MIYKFVRWDVSPLSDYENITHYRLHEKLERDEEPTREEKNRWLVFTNNDPVYKFMGYAYDFREFLTKFWVETKYYGIITVWAWDKTAIRNNGATKGLQIKKIVEVE